MSGPTVRACVSVLAGPEPRPGKVLARSGGASARVHVLHGPHVGGLGAPPRASVRVHAQHGQQLLVTHSHDQYVAVTPMVMPHLMVGWMAVGQQLLERHCELKRQHASKNGSTAGMILVSYQYPRLSRYRYTGMEAQPV